MEQEIRPPDLKDLEIFVPQFIKEILAEMTFQARSSPEISQHSGVSCRVSIRSFESILGSALRRCLDLGEKKVVPRVTDIDSTYPAIAGKLELEYESADRNVEEIVGDLTRRAVKVVFDEHFKVEDLSSVVESFQNGMEAQVSQAQPSEDYMDGLKVIPEMKEVVQTLVDPKSPPEVSSAIEFILEGLHLANKLNREVVKDRRTYK